IWALQSFNFRLHFVEDSSDSILAWIAGYLTPIFKPIGLGDWRVVTALISGFMAKENVVATLEVLGAGAYFTSVTAVPMLIFCLLYTPCVAAISAISRELGKGKALFVVAFQIAIAWIFAYIGYLIALL
ncbi:MAG: ferrous iron transporter B, partial [Bacteroidales bacterium]|nr:ferrous iron transporter B [Bacteroidales bacterium]